MAENMDKKADLAGPGVSTYEEVAKILPDDYEPLLNNKDRMKALFKVKNFIEENLCKELNLFMVQVPLIVTVESGVNDYLDRDGSRTPIDFQAGLAYQCLQIFVEYFVFFISQGFESHKYLVEFFFR